MSKYQPLKEFLENSEETIIELTFKRIERIIGEELPPSSYKHRALWSNNPKGHAMTEAWLAAGYKSEQVDMDRQRVVFRRAVESKGNLSAAERRRLGKQRLAAIQQKMRGTIYVPEGVDIMEPIELEWDAMKD